MNGNLAARPPEARASETGDKTEVQLAIAAIQAEAEALNLTLYRLCRLAEVEPSKVARWGVGAHEPTLSDLKATMEKLEAALAAEKQRLLKAITGRAA